MADTKRAKAWHPYNKEGKRERQTHFRAYRHRMNRYTRDTGKWELIAPYIKTQGWLTW